MKNPDFSQPGPTKMGLLVGTLMIGLLAIGAPALAQPPGSADAIKGLVLAGEFMVTVGGEELEGGEVYHAEQAGAYLVMAPSLSSPWLIDVRSRRVEGVSLMKVQKRPDGNIDLLPGAAFKVVGPFQISGKSLVFQHEGKQVVLKTKPPLVGNQTSTSLAEYNPAYAQKSGQYEPDAGALKALAKEGRKVEVVVYFGSWCPVCSRLVPRVMKVAEALEGSKIEFEYYGLPQPMTSDPKTQQLKLTGVPTSIVYVDGKEVGRMTGKDLYSPESSLGNLLNGA